MPRNYIASKRGKEMQYDRENLKKAAELVKSGALSIRKAAAQFSIPKSTLADRVSGRFETSPDVKPGRKPALPPQLEAKIVSNVKLAAARGVGVSRAQLLRRTGTLCKSLNIDTSKTFKNSTPGNGWWEGLKKRNPTLTIRKPEKLGSNRARALNETVTGEYFRSLGDLLCSLGIEDQPQCIWNADETGLQFEHNPVRVIAEKGSKSVVSKVSNSRQNLTVMICGNALGRRMPPMLVVKGKTQKSLHEFNAAAAPEGTKWAVQEKGWMTDELGEMWFRNVFLENCGPQRPQLLIMDGHSSHESLAILELAAEQNIHLLCLPPHCTHYLQPMDRTVFGPFKKAYNRVCSDYLAENCLNTVNKWSFPGLFSKAVEEAISEKNIQNGFKACGIYPFNPNCLPSNALQPSVPSDRALEAPSNTVHVESADVSFRQSDAPQEEVSPEAPGVLPSCEEGSLTLSELGSDPGLILELLTSGELDIVQTDEEVTLPETICDSSELDCNIPSSLAEHLVMPQATEGPTHTCPSESKAADWNFEVNSIFLPPAPQSVKLEDVTKHTQKRRNSFHRLLTNDDVLEEKRAAYHSKCQREQAKLDRKNKRLLKITKKK